MTLRGRCRARHPGRGRRALGGRHPGHALARHPDLPAGTNFRLERTFGERGELLDRNGKALMPQGTVHAVQIDPVNATPASAAALEPIVDADKGGVAGQGQSAKATASGSEGPIPVITYRDADWKPRAAHREAITGVIAPTSEQPLGRTCTFAQPLLGSFGEVPPHGPEERGPLRGR